MYKIQLIACVQEKNTNKQNILHTPYLCVVQLPADVHVYVCESTLPPSLGKENPIN